MPSVFKEQQGGIRGLEYGSVLDEVRKERTGRGQRSCLALESTVITLAFTLNDIRSG